MLSQDDRQTARAALIAALLREGVERDEAERLAADGRTINALLAGAA